MCVILPINILIKKALTVTSTLLTQSKSKYIYLLICYTPTSVNYFLFQCYTIHNQELNDGLESQAIQQHNQRVNTYSFPLFSFIQTIVYKHLSLHYFFTVCRNCTLMIQDFDEMEIYNHAIITKRQNCL